MHRRAVIAGMVGLAAGVSPLSRSLLAQSGQPPADLQGCMSEPGLALYFELLAGQPVIDTRELLPGASWQLYSSPYSLTTFLFPPDWVGQTLFASTFTQTAAPQWTAQQTNISGIVSSRVTASDSSAAWESVAGGLQGVAVSLEQVVAMAEGGLLGDGYTATRLCGHTEATVNGGTAWATAVNASGTIVLSNGTLFADQSGPFSVITYYAMAGPQAAFEQLMRTVFLPIQVQLVQGGGELTPTPTP